MQTRELYINGKLVELSDVTRIGVTYQANNIGELQNRQGSFTNTFRIPNNAHNLQTFEHLNLMTSTTVIPYRRNEVTYIEDGLEIISDGEGIIKGSDKKFIYIDAVGGNIDLSRAIGDMIVGELYDNDPTHIWNLTNVFASRDGSEYYTYPMIDWRIDLVQFFDTPTVDVRQMLPVCVVPKMFDRLSDKIGYTFTGSYIDSDEHQNMILTPDAFSLNTDFIDDEQDKADTVTSDTHDDFFVQVDEENGQGSYIAPVNFPLELFNNEGLFANGSYYPTVNAVGKLRLRGTFAMRRIYINGGLGFLETPQTREHWFVVQIKRGGTVIAEKTYDHEIGKISDLDSFKEYVIDLETDEQVLQAGQQYFANIVIHAERHGNADTQVEFGFTPNRFVEFIHTPEEGIVFGNEIKFRDLFRMRVRDVLKDILNLRGLIIQTNSYTREVQFNFFQDLIDNIPIAKKWSDKVDVRESVLSYKFGKYGQRNNFKFKEDEDVTDELGDYYFDIDDETLADEVDVVKINHSATEQRNKYLGRNIPEIEAIDSLSKWQKPTYRLLQMDRETTSFTVGFTDGASTSNATTDIPFCKFEGFDVLVPKYYEALQGILERTKSFRLMVRLNSADIHQLDFSIPISLDIPELNISGYFYINVISNYKSGLTAVEFVRL